MPCWEKVCCNQKGSLNCVRRVSVATPHASFASSWVGHKSLHGKVWCSLASLWPRCGYEAVWTRRCDLGSECVVTLKVSFQAFQGCSTLLYFLLCVECRHDGWSSRSHPVFLIQKCRTFILCTLSWCTVQQHLSRYTQHKLIKSGKSPPLHSFSMFSVYKLFWHLGLNADCLTALLSTPTLPYHGTLRTANSVQLF